MNDEEVGTVVPSNTKTNRGHPHKSTTHEEQYFHVEQQGTVFFRKEHGKWLATASFRNPKDNFCKRTGRNVARRKWFAGGPYAIGDEAEKVTYEDAVAVFNMLKPVCKEEIANA